jgi:hypothetical protein
MVGSCVRSIESPSIITGDLVGWKLAVLNDGALVTEELHFMRSEF